MPRPIRHRSASEFPAQRVFETLVQPGYLEARLAELGGKGAELVKLDVGGDPTERAEYTVKQGIGREHLPAVIQRVLSGDLVIERTESWRRTAPGSYDGTVVATVIGAPGRITGTLRLANPANPANRANPANPGAGPGANPGSELVLDGSAQVPLPLFGGRIEEVIAEQVQRLLARESDFMTTWLRRATQR